jgi:predicted AAA+ superfamily ATPase
MLAGRAISKSLYPFIYDEISSIPDQAFSLYKTLEYGSLPKVYFTHDENLKFDILQTYTNTYIKEEIKEEALVRNLGAFNHFLLLAANENGNVLNYSNIAQDVGVSYKMVKEYYQILLDTLMGFMLMPIQKSVRQQISKSPKFYFFDTGVQRALAEKLQAPLIKGTEEFGKVFEHWLIKEIIYKADYQRRNYKFSFYRVNDNAEVDLIIQKPTGEMIAIEIKASDNPKANKLSGLMSFAKVFPEAKLVCASLVTNRRDLDSGISIMPWQEVLEMI